MRGRRVREFGMDIYTLLYLKWITNTVQHRELCSMLYSSLDRRVVRKRMDTRVCMAEFLLCHLKLSRCSLAMLLLFSHGGVSDPL